MAHKNHRRKNKATQSHRPSIYDVPKAIEMNAGVGGGDYYGGNRRRALQKKGIKRLVNREERHKRNRETPE